jgi:hypothetical protein
MKQRPVGICRQAKLSPACPGAGARSARRGRWRCHYRAGQINLGEELCWTARFTPAPGSPVAVGASPDFVTVADFNNDGKADLAVANASHDKVTVLLGNGEGGVTPPAGSPFGVRSHPMSMSVADFNGDNLPDFAVLNSGGENDALLDSGNILLMSVSIR